MDLADDADETFLAACLKTTLSPSNSSRSQVLHLRQKGHVFDLPRCTLEIHKRSFLKRVCLNQIKSNLFVT